MLFTPLPPVTNCQTFSDPLKRDVLYGRPLRRYPDSNPQLCDHRSSEFYTRFRMAFGRVSMLEWKSEVLPNEVLPNLPSILSRRNARGKMPMRVSVRLSVFVMLQS